MADKITLGNLTIEIIDDLQSEELIYTFNGDVDEYFQHSEVPRIKKKHITFDLANVTNFNSCGIKEWIYLVKDISQLGDLVFKRCSVTMVDQINMVPSSLGNARIESFHAPYYYNCNCFKNKEANILLTLSQVSEEIAENRAPEITCEKCGTSLEFDALEESYFLFASKSRVGRAS